MGRTVDVREKVSSLPTYSGELGLDLRKAADRFKWFLASILFAKRTYREFEKGNCNRREHHRGWLG